MQVTKRESKADDKTRFGLRGVIAKGITVVVEKPEPVASALAQANSSNPLEF
jgi:hypothetical protein